MTFSTEVIHSIKKTAKTAKSLRRDWDLICGCYNSEKGKFDKTLCTKASLSSENESFTCTCIGSYSPCYMVYKFPQWKALAIALPFALAIPLVIVGIFIWIMCASK
jgi:hypothetical protein